MVRGIGNDIIEMERIRKALEKNSRFFTKLFTPREQEYLRSRKDFVQAVAGRFAAKEAVAKALGTGFRSFGMADIEILGDDIGKPVVLLSEKVRSAVKGGEDLQVMVTISHSRDHALATALAMEEVSH
ncbi:holo-ACP synthase [Alkalibacter rhizosphaerae]|uniref:Holo-[acyl-carrier-protein] synthase n=1 Tax=Alkalibacter rhizosphaerae TaxID=2815577 RepID=A0A974XGH1_9FIRM|nr:holo-ACP synthase [Alkalibacter rhizosphaerae]QSX08280.1 holo-ACP synthase [Alkalibacter rhizosphaerae]